MPRRSFDLLAFYPPFDKNVNTEIEAEDDAEAASYRRLVVAKVGVRSHVRLDEIEELHELIASFADRQCAWSKESHECEPSSRHQTLYFLPHRQTRFLRPCLTSDSMYPHGRPRA